MVLFWKPVVQCLTLSNSEEQPGSAPDQNHSGFTLIEVTIALVIFLIGVVALLQFMVVAVSVDRQGRDRVVATTLAQMQADNFLSTIWIGSTVPTQLATGGAIPLAQYSNPFLSPNPIPVAGYVTYYNYSGTQIGSGASPPAGTYFVSQWQILDCDAISCDSTCGTPPCSSKRITVVVTALSKAFGRSYPSSTITVYKSEIN